MTTTRFANLFHSVSTVSIIPGESINAVALNSSGILSPLHSFR